MQIMWEAYVFHVCALKGIIWLTNKCTLIHVFNHIIIIIIIIIIH